MRVAVVGTGRVAQSFLRDLNHFGVVVSGFVSGSPERIRSFSRETGVPGFASITELVAAHPDTDVALVVNANHQHYAATLEALGLNLHVLCEKPMATTLEECQRMVETAGESGGSLQINFEYIHSRMPARITELLDQGFFGRVLGASCIDSRGHWWADAPDAEFQTQSRLRRDLGGGIVFHCGIHQVDILRTIMGSFHSVRAYRSRERSLPYYPEDVPDRVMVAMTTPDERLATLEIFHNRAPCWYRRYPPTTVDWSTVPGHEFKLSLTGTDGSCLADFYGARLHLFRYEHGQKDVLLERTEDYSHYPQNELHHDMTGFLKRYLERIAAGEPPAVDCRESLETMRLAFAIEESISDSKEKFL